MQQIFSAYSAISRYSCWLPFNYGTRVRTVLHTLLLRSDMRTPILTSINEVINLYHSRVRLQLNVSQRIHALKLLIDVERRLLNFVDYVSIYYTYHGLPMLWLRDAKNSA
jgi:hypothetical protein